jgi:hypothetical protein
LVPQILLEGDVEGDIEGEIECVGLLDVDGEEVTLGLAVVFDEG